MRGYMCCGSQMVVTTTRRPCRDLVVRYRRCLVCDSRVVTREIVATRTPGKGISKDGTTNRNEPKD